MGKYDNPDRLSREFPVLGKFYLFLGKSCGWKRIFPAKFA